MQTAVFLATVAAIALFAWWIARQHPNDAASSCFRVEDLGLSIVQRPRGAGLFVVPLLEARKGLIVDAEENRERPLKGIVVAVSAGGAAPETGRPVEILSKVGDLVEFGKYAGLAYQLQGRGDLLVKAYIMRDSEILASQPAGTYDLTIHDGDPNKMHLAGLSCALCPRPTDEAAVNRLREIAYGERLPEDTDAKPDGPSLVITG